MTRRICMLIREEYATALNNHLVSVSSPSGSQTPAIPPTPYLSRDIGGSFFTERDLQGRTRGAALGSIFDLLGHKPTPEGTLRGSTGGFGAFSGASTPATSTSNSPVGSPSSSQILQRPNPLVQTPFAAPFSSDTEFDFSQEKDFSKRSFNLKPVFIDAIQELLDEVELTYRSVGEQSLDHIHSGCVFFSPFFLIPS
jgi:translation initiation factor eIF-2B subunit beta